MIRWLDSRNAADDFPPPEAALRRPPGLLAAGGDLSPARLLAAYRRGIFPWYEEGQPILWWCPEPRAVLFPDELRVSRSLRRTLRRGLYQASVDQAFPEVVEGCARRDSPVGTWITHEMSAAFTRLHELGFAHSVEIWRDGVLAGGVYGVLLGGVFFGESMFSRAADASKIALVHLRAYGGARGLVLIDCQIPSPHLASLGSREIPRRAFLELLARHCPAEPAPQAWGHPPRRPGEAG
jgi:leucyl/phenylalanyl-tRNA--protein transferase